MTEKTVTAEPELECKAARGLLRFIEETYLTAFTLFYRMGGSDWSANVNKGKGVAGVAIFEGFFILAVLGFIGILKGHKVFSKTPILAPYLFYFLLCALNHYFLVLCRKGTRFEQDFNQLKKSKRVVLVLSSIGAMLVIGVFCAFTASIHRGLPKAH